uniref:Uncharacterized protein n=1 Tax=Aegilops tauschii subsp. strangulata TaxID=200361 RepID=A0A453NX99_AEGTS
MEEERHEVKQKEEMKISWKDILCPSFEECRRCVGCVWRSRGRKCLHHPHTKDGSKLTAGDEIHAHITCMNADRNNTAQIDDLASSLAQLQLGPCYPSITIYQPRRPRMHTRRKTSRRRRSHCGWNGESSCGAPCGCNRESRCGGGCRCGRASSRHRIKEES